MNVLDAVKKGLIEIGRFVVTGRNLDVGKNCKISDFVKIKDDVTLGDNVTIKEFTRIDNNVIIGSDVQIRGHSVICNDMIIEDKCDLGHGLYCVNHVKLNKFGGNDVTVPPIIRYGARIGARVTLMPAVVIGKNAIVGEGCIVRKDVPAGTVYIQPNTTTKLRDIKEEEKIK